MKKNMLSYLLTELGWILWLSAESNGGLWKSWKSPSIPIVGWSSNRGTTRVGVTINVDWAEIVKTNIRLNDLKKNRQIAVGYKNNFVTTTKSIWLGFACFCRQSISDFRWSECDQNSRTILSSLITLPSDFWNLFRILKRIELKNSDRNWYGIFSFNK